MCVCVKTMSVVCFLSTKLHSATAIYSVSANHVCYSSESIIFQIFVYAFYRSIAPYNSKVSSPKFEYHSHCFSIWYDIPRLLLFVRASLAIYIFSCWIYWKLKTKQQAIINFTISCREIMRAVMLLFGTAVTKMHLPFLNVL